MLGLSGDLSRADAAFARALVRHAGGAPRVVLDLDAVTRLGARAIGTIEELVAELERKGSEVGLRARRQEIHTALALLGGTPPPPLRDDPRGSWLDRVLYQTLRTVDAFLAWALLFRNALGHAVHQLLWPPRGTRLLAIRAMRQVGSRATPLIALIGGLLGAVLAMQGGIQLERYGQEVMIADLVGLSMAKEIGPLLTAVLVAGRSGSSLTAEIGTMKVTEEVDALRIMGVDPVAWLVAPRLLALAITLPLLTAVADVIGILGGLVVGIARFDVGSEAFLNRIAVSVPFNDVATGLLKAFLFALIIASIAAYQGFQTRGGANEVGGRTTRSVVLSIIWVIIVNAIFTLTEDRFS